MERTAANPEPESRPADTGLDEARSGTSLIVSGLTVGAIGVAGAVVLGATCPVCVVAAPALVGAGAYKKWRARRRPEPEHD